MSLKGSDNMFRLSEIRKKNKLSQQVLADILGISRSTVAMWETEGSQPDNDSLKAISDYSDNEWENL